MTESSTSKGNELIGQTIDRGRYEVLKVIGEGGMGRVFEAKQVNIGRLVAIKVLHRHWAQDPKLLERFKREALTASQFRHPNTVMVYDYGETERGEFYIIMELLQGQSLLSLLDKEGPLSLDRTLKIIEQVCGALSEVHRCGVIHRDLKPENIQIDPRDGHPDFVKLLDFSIAKIVNDNTLSEANKKALTLQGAVFGTPQYMSPEQVRGKPLDHRTDIYALGVIFYQMLTGHVPFAAETPQGTMMAHLTDPIPDPCALFPKIKIHPEASRLVQDCLVKDPKKRVASAEELSQRLKELSARLELEDPTHHTDVNPSITTPSAELKVTSDSEIKALAPKEEKKRSPSGRRYVTQETEQFDAEVHHTPSGVTELPSDEPQTSKPDAKADDAKADDAKADNAKADDAKADDAKAGDAKADKSVDEADAGDAAEDAERPGEAAQDDSREDEPTGGDASLSDRGASEALPAHTEDEGGLDAPAEPAVGSMTIRGFGSFRSTSDLKQLHDEMDTGSQARLKEINPSEGAPQQLDELERSTRARGFMDESVPTGIHSSIERSKGGAWRLLLLLVFVGSGVGGWWFKDQLSSYLKPSPRVAKPGNTINISTGARDTTYRIESVPPSSVYELNGTTLRSETTPYSYTQPTSAVSRLILKADGYKDRVITVGFTTSSATQVNQTRLIKVALVPKSTKPSPSKPPQGKPSSKPQGGDAQKSSSTEPHKRKKTDKKSSRDKLKAGSRTDSKGRTKTRRQKRKLTSKPPEKKQLKRKQKTRQDSQVKRDEGSASEPKKNLGALPPKTLDVSPESSKQAPKEVKVTAEDVITDEPPKKGFAPQKMPRKVPELKPRTLN